LFCLNFVVFVYLIKRLEQKQKHSICKLQKDKINYLLNVRSFVAIHKGTNNLDFFKRKLFATVALKGTL